MKERMSRIGPTGKQLYAEFRACLVNVLGDAGLRDGVSVCLNGPAILLLGLAVEDLVGDVLLARRSAIKLISSPKCVMTIVDWTLLLVRTESTP